MCEKHNLDTFSKMDPPRQVSRRGPGTGPVFRTFKKSAMHSFSASNSFSIRTPSVPLGMGIPPLMIAQAQLLPQSSNTPAPAAINAAADVAPVIVIVPPTTPAFNTVTNRPRIIPDQSSIMKTSDATSVDLKKKSAGLFNVDAELNPRSRGNRGIRTSGIHKVEDAAVIAAAIATLNRTTCLKDLVERKTVDRKTEACKIEKPKQGRRQQGKPRRSSVSIEKVISLACQRIDQQHYSFTLFTRLLFLSYILFWAFNLTLCTVLCCAIN